MLTRQRKLFILSEAPALKSLLYMILPTLCAAIIVELNTAIDAFFLKQVGPYASSAVTISWPVICVMLAISYMFSLGSSIKAGHYLGAKDFLKAREMVSTTLWITLWLNIVLALLLLTNLKSVILFFGADSKTFPYTHDYLKIMLPGMVFEDIAFIAGMYLRAEGNSRIVVLVTLLQTVSNTLINYMLITRWHWGAEGAAWASVFSFFLQTVILLGCLFSAQSLIRPSFRLIKVSWNYFKSVGTVGFSGFTSLILFAMSQSIMNREASTFGTSYLTANTILLFVTGIAFSVGMGMTDGAEPLLAYAVGAGNRKRLLLVTKYLIIISLFAGLGMGLSLLLFPDSISAFFTGDKQGIALAENGVRLAGVSLFFIPLITVLKALCVSLGKGIMATFMNAFRQTMACVLILAFSHLWGGKGLVLSQPVALLAGSLCLALFIPAIASRIKSIPDCIHPVSGRADG